MPQAPMRSTEARAGPAVGQLFSNPGHSITFVKKLSPSPASHGTIHCRA